MNVRPVRGGGWWALVVAVVAPALWVAPAGAETTLEVEAGYSGRFVQGREVPVRVRVAADRLLRGTVEVVIGNLESATPVAIAVEVPGASQKEFLLTVRGGLEQNPDVTARLRQDDNVVASARTSVLASGDTELVGVLPGALRGRSLPGTSPLAVDAGTARFVALSEVDLEQAPASLGPLSTLAADADEIGRLSPGARAGVLRWIEAGGRLLVDSAKGKPVAGLPDAWQPGPSGRTVAGQGEVVATDGSIAAGRWSGLVEPSGWASGASFGRGDLPVASSLVAESGLRTPELGWLVGFLAVYVVVVGPVLFLLVRRRGRAELAWIAIPLVAVLFSTGSYVVGRDLRRATQLVHASVLSSGLTGSTATSFVGVFSRRGETVSVGFPAQWSNGPFATVGRTGMPSVVTYTAEGPEARLPLDAGQFGMVQASGPVAQDAGLEITATAAGGGRATGTVRNRSPYRLDGVAVFMGGNATLVGALGPDEQQPFAVANTGQAGPAFGDGAEFQVWAAFGAQDPGQVADFGLWQAALRAAGPGFISPGAVVAAGWTRDFVPEVRLDGRARRPEGRTLVVGRQLVKAGADGASAVTVRRDVVRDPFVDKFGGGGRSGAVVRFVLPAGADPSKLVLKSPFGGAELWRDGAWQPAECTGAGCAAIDIRGGLNIGCPPGVVPCPPQPVPMRPVPFGTDLSVPPAAVRDGVVWVRVQGPTSGPGQSLTIVQAA